MKCDAAKDTDKLCYVPVNNVHGCVYYKYGKCKCRYKEKRFATAKVWKMQDFEYRGIE